MTVPPASCRAHPSLAARLNGWRRVAPDHVRDWHGSMSEPYVEVSRKHAARITGAIDPDVARMLAEDLPDAEMSADEETEAAFEKMLREICDGMGD